MPGRARTRSRWTVGRRGDDENRIAARLAAGLEQERNVEHGDHGADAETRLRKGFSSSRTSGCTMASSCFMRSGLLRTGGSELRAVDGAVRDRAGKGLLDRRRGAAAIEPVHGGIGIVNGNAEHPENIGRGRFSHADGAGQSEHEGHLRRLDIGKDQRPQRRA